MENKTQQDRKEYRAVNTLAPIKTKI